MTTRMRFLHRNTVNVCKPASFCWENCDTVVMRFCKIVVVLKQVKNTVVVLAFFDQQKGSVTSNKNNGANYTTNKE